jgi:hypothetical protein
MLNGLHGYNGTQSCRGQSLKKRQTRRRHPPSLRLRWTRKHYGGERPGALQVAVATIGQAGAEGHARDLRSRRSKAVREAKTGAPGPPLSGKVRLCPPFAWEDFLAVRGEDGADRVASPSAASCAAWERGEATVSVAFRRFPSLSVAFRRLPSLRTKDFFAVPVRLLCLPKAARGQMPKGRRCLREFWSRSVVVGSYMPKGGARIVPVPPFIAFYRHLSPFTASYQESFFKAHLSGKVSIQSAKMAQLGVLPFGLRGPALPDEKEAAFPAGDVVAA